MSALRCHVTSRSSSSKPCQHTLYSRVCPVVRLPVSRTSTMEWMVASGEGGPGSVSQPPPPGAAA
eukprot:926598-Prymnesium_polylepis.1